MPVIAIVDSLQYRVLRRRLSGDQYVVVTNSHEGEVYFPTVRALRCGFGEEAGILRLGTRGVAVDNNCADCSSEVECSVRSSRVALILHLEDNG